MKDLTLRYSLTQLTFWAGATGTASFATTFLLRSGLPSPLVGSLLAGAGLLSCMTQPLLAGAADKAKRFPVPGMMAFLSVGCSLCCLALLIPGLPPLALGLLYALGLWCSDAMMPLMNALYVGYNQGKHRIRFGIARCIGSAASALISLILGHVIAALGLTWMLVLLVLLRVLCILLLLGFPKIAAVRSARGTSSGCTVGQFFRRYRWYCASMAGVLFLGMFHAMNENYLIAIVAPFGGGSSQVGTALFIACITGAGMLLFADKIHGRLSTVWMLRIAGMSFLLKAVLFCFAPGISTIYALELLQMTSYAFLNPAQIYFAEERVAKEDMVKGQAFSTAAYSLGCSAGNFSGGVLLEAGLHTLLLAGVGMALAGTVLLFLTVDKRDAL